MNNQEAFQNCQRLPQIDAELLFDTATDPHPRGVRRGHDLSRHLLYEAEGLCLDIRIDRDPESWAAVVVGQIADRADPLKPATGVPVWLLHEHLPVASTEANRLGEFRFACRPVESMSLCLKLQNEKHIEIPIEPLWDVGLQEAREELSS